METISIIFIIIGIIVFSIIVFVRPSNKQQQEYREQYERKEQENFGIYGEYAVIKMLNDISNIHKSYVFNNFTFMDDDGYSSNIDHIFICNGGVFIIETKSNKGAIYGSANEQYWFAQKHKWQKDKGLINPINQNQGHINHLKKMMGPNAPKMVSMIIFPFADSLKNVDCSFAYSIISAKHFILDKICESKYNNQFVEKTYKKLLYILSVYGISLEEHKENIRQKYGD